MTPTCERCGHSNLEDLIFHDYWYERRPVFEPANPNPVIVTSQGRRFKVKHRKPAGPPRHELVCRQVWRCENRKKCTERMIG